MNLNKIFEFFNNSGIDMKMKLSILLQKFGHHEVPDLMVSYLQEFELSKSAFLFLHVITHTHSHAI